VFELKGDIHEFMESDVLTLNLSNKYSFQMVATYREEVITKHPFPLIGDREFEIVE
jgi:hypothetical protein